MASDELVFDVILFILAFCIFMSNMVVLMAIFKAEHLHIPSNIFVAGMALADASVGAIALPLLFVTSLQLKLDFQSCLYIHCIYFYSFDVSLYMLLALTFDRFYAIRFPFKYHQEVDCKDAIMAISVVWTLGALVAVIPFVRIDDEDHKAYKGICSFTAFFPLYRQYIGLMAFFIFLGTLLILIIVNSYILCVAERHKRHNMAIIHCIDRTAVRRNDLKAVKMLVSMVAVFIICYLPINIELVYMHLSGHFDKTLNRVLLIIYLLNSLLNPFLYAVSNKRIRRACMNLILCRPLNRIMSDQTPNTSYLTRNKKSAAVSNLSNTEGSESPADIEFKEPQKTESKSSFSTKKLSNDIEYNETLKTGPRNFSFTETLAAILHRWSESHPLTSSGVETLDEIRASDDEADI